MRRFFPVSDEQVYSNPQIFMQLVPYQIGSCKPKKCAPENVIAVIKAEKIQLAEGQMFKGKRND